VSEPAKAEDVLEYDKNRKFKDEKIRRRCKMNNLKVTSKVILLAFCMILFSITFVSAEDPAYTFRQYETVDLKISCLDVDKSVCGSNIGCNITILYPDHTVLVDGNEMTYNANYYNYTLVPSNTSVLGIYSASVSCVGVFHGFTPFLYEITTTGRIPQIRLHLFLILCSLGLFVTGLFTKSNWLGLLSGIFFSITGIYFMIYGFADMADLYTRTIGGILIGFGLIIITLSAWEWTYHED